MGELISKIEQLLKSEGFENFTVTVERDLSPIIDMGKVIDFDCNQLPKITISFQ